jgi:hypothetical protein
LLLFWLHESFCLPRQFFFMLRALARIDTCNASSAFSNCQRKEEEIIGALLAYWTSRRYSSSIDVLP